MYVDALLNQGLAADWGITGVGLRAPDRKMLEAMEAQDCLYTLVVKHLDGSLEPRVIGSIVDYLFAPDDPEKVLERMTDPATRAVERRRKSRRFVAPMGMVPTSRITLGRGRVRLQSMLDIRRPGLECC